MNIFLSCTYEKADHRCKAAEMYSASSIFSKALAIAKKKNPDHIYILSAKHYLLELDDVIEPYNLTLNDMSVDERKEWTKKVLQKMKEKHIDLSERTYFFAGNNYIEFLKDSFTNYEILYKGKGIGEIEQNLCKMLKENLIEYLQSHLINLTESLKK